MPILHYQWGLDLGLLDDLDKNVRRLLRLTKFTNRPLLQCAYFDSTILDRLKPFRDRLAAATEKDAQEMDEKISPERKYLLNYETLEYVSCLTVLYYPNLI